MADWQRLTEELNHWQQAGQRATLWWRDDDAQQATPALQRLAQLSHDFEVPLALAVIPANADASLAAEFDRYPRLIAFQHGFSHHNHAEAPQRKCELGPQRTLADVEAELVRGRRALQTLLGARFFPVLVPPWNRLCEELPARLPLLGFLGLSTLGPRCRTAIAELNVHVDLIDWRGGRGFQGEQAVLAQLVAHLQARRSGRVDPVEATGIMTHHLAHDGGCWEFIERLLGYVQGHPASAWIDPRTAFSSA